MQASVVIPAFNAEGTIKVCLESVIAQTSPPLEIIVVDDASTDDTPGLAIGYSGVTVVSQNYNQGCATARNRGAQVARGDILLFVDADTVLPPEALDTIQQLFVMYPDAACVCGIYAKESLINRGFVASYRALQSFYWKKTGCGFTTRFTVFAGAIRKKVFESVGGFDERFRQADLEDYEISHRLLARGYRIYQTDQIQSRHDDIHTFGVLVATLWRRSFLYPPLLRHRGALDTGYLNRNRAAVYPLVLSSWFLLPASWIIPAWVCAVLWLAILAGIIFLDRGLYRTFRQERGVIFMLACIPLHYSITSVMAAGFIAGCIRMATQGRQRKYAS